MRSTSWLVAAAAAVVLSGSALADELKVPAGKPVAGHGVFESETGAEAGTFRTGDNAGRFNQGGSTPRA